MDVFQNSIKRNINDDVTRVGTHFLYISVHVKIRNKVSFIYMKSQTFEGFKDQVLAIDVHFVFSIIGNGMLYYLKCDVGKYINVLDTYRFNAKPQIEIDRRSCM